MDPPQGWTLVDLEEHVGPGEQGLIMMQKKTAAETVSVLSSFQVRQRFLSVLSSLLAPSVHPRCPTHTTILSCHANAQFVGTEDDFEEEEEEDEDESAAPSFICLLVIDKHGSSKAFPPFDPVASPCAFAFCHSPTTSISHSLTLSCFLSSSIALLPDLSPSHSPISTLPVHPSVHHQQDSRLKPQPSTVNLLDP
eukprot:2153845-Rhodomonas_salina.2